jgi:UDP-N-acetylmuramyl pentapeptide synthase
VTGSVGKTTTKEVIASVLSHAEARPFVGRVRKTPQNLNDNFGLPLTVLGFRRWPASRMQTGRWMCVAPFRALKLAFFGPYADVLVLEYAVCFDGDIPALARLAPPTVAVVTAVGPAHLEVLGTIERIADAKAALVRAVPPSGLVVLGLENPYLAEMAQQTSARVVRVGGVGRSLSDNVARVVGSFFGVGHETIEAAIAATPAVRQRLRFENVGPLTLIDDTINANPLSMKLALDTLEERAASAGRKVALLGYMAELGDDAARYHEEVGAVAHARADVVVGVGPLAQHYEPSHWFETADQCVANLPRLLREKDLVLVKGSASSKMTAVATAIRNLARESAAAFNGSGSLTDRSSSQTA